MRKDAERNRLKLIQAASEIMREGSGDVPMEVIAERAGLTRGTLYRNFVDRQAMYEAVLEHDLLLIAETLEASHDEDPLAFIRLMAELTMVYDKFLVALSDMDDYDAAKNETRMMDAMTAPLAHAQAEGRLRADLTTADVLVACRMLASHWRLSQDQDPAKALEHRLGLLLRGLGPG